jgi:hypothetical protein
MDTTAQVDDARFDTVAGTLDKKKIDLLEQQEEKREGRYLP